MKVTKRQLRRIIKEEVEAQAGAATDAAIEEEISSRAKILKGLEIAGIDPEKLKALPTSGHQLKALMAMIGQAIETTAAGKGIAAQKKTSRATKGMV